MYKCSICGRESTSILKVDHKELGTISICIECCKEEAKDKKIRPSKRICCCR